MGEYDSTGVKILNLPESIRRRPGMYFLDTGWQAINSIVCELVSNVADRFLVGEATQVSVSFDDTVITVSDDGPGLPYDQAGLEHRTLAEDYFCRLHVTATADGHAPHIHVGCIGLGLAVLNAAAEWMDVETYRAGHVYHQRFGKGKILKEMSKSASSDSQGTTITLKPDPELFEPCKPNLDDLRRSMNDLVHFLPGFRVMFQNECLQSRDGLIDLALKRYGELKNADESPREAAFDERRDGIQVQVAGVGTAATKPQMWSWVNGSPTQSGSHVDGALRGFRKSGWMPALVLIHVIMHDPQFAGPTKEVLCNKEVRTAVEKLIIEALI